MIIKKFFLFHFLVVLILSRVVFAEEECKNMPKVSSSAELNQIKNLAGVWEGTSSNDKMDKKVTVEYQVSSGGSAVVEKLFPGTSHEMVSVYHDENGKLVMTHYCMLGNQPKLVLTGANDQVIKMELDPHQSTLDPQKEMHMHALRLSILSPTEITQNWVSYADGKQKDVVTFALNRVK